MKTTYYADELSKVNVKSEYAPTIVINSGDGSGKTKHLNLNDESAKELVKWLTANYNIKPDAKDFIEIPWSIHDVLDRAEQNRMTITEGRAREILTLIKVNHDATIGITWETIDSYLYDVTRKK